MGFAAILGLLGPIFTDIIRRVLPDPEKQAEAQLKINELLLVAQTEADKAEAIMTSAKKDIIITEMSANTWFSDWRAKLMTMCTLMVGFNWILVPVLNALLYFIGTEIKPNAIPSEAWLLLNVGLGGYIGEKTMQNWQHGKVEKARAENPPIIDEAALAEALRKNLFKQGFTQAQWDAVLKATKESVRE